VKLYVFRHGEAGHAYTSDSDRQLTEKGRYEIQSKAQAKAEELKAAEIILHSPLVRARQSAEVLKEFLSTPVVKCVDWLKPGSRVSFAVEALFQLQEREEWQSIILVTHLPFVSSYIEQLCGLSAGRIAMSTGSVVALETEVIARGCARLNWQLY